MLLASTAPDKLRVARIGSVESIKRLGSGVEGVYHASGE
jgi:hypothetical protein